MWWTIGWICAAVGMSCASVPDIDAIQSAYEREAASGSTLHDKGLQILRSRCHDNSADRFLCEVMFISKGDPTERLYFDIVAVTWIGDGWQLKSGLCKH
jgi:hypothetical protein